MTPLAPHPLRHAFTLVEFLIVVAILSVLMAMLMPAINRSREAARIAICAGQMRQHGTMTAQYTLDCKGFLPMPAAPHQLQVGGYLWSKDIAARTGALATCPMGAGKTYAVGFGWFYWQGYVPAVRNQSGFTKGVKLGIFDCPGAANFRGMGISQAQSQETLYGSFSYITPVLAAQNNNINTGDPYWDCNADACNAGYISRGWGRTTGVGTYKQATPKADQWKPDDAVAVCMEKWDAFTSTYLDAHGDGLNIRFLDGHASFGGKDISGASVGMTGAIKPHAYYTMKAGGTYAIAIDAFSGYAYAGGTPFVNLWTYYSTNNP